MDRPRRTIFIKLLPLLIPFTLVFVMGFVLTVVQSLGGLLPLEVSPFGGAYADLFRSPWFGKSFRFTLAVSFFSAAASVLLGTAAGYGVWRMPPPGRRLAAVYRVPLILPHIAVAFIVVILWSQTGVVSAVFHLLGLVGDYSRFPDIIYGRNGISLVLAYIYKETPFVMLMVIALLRRYDRKQIETARMLGGGEVRIFFRLVVPFLLPVMHSVFVILFVYSFGAFDIPFILGRSEPSMLSVKVFDLYFTRGLESRPAALAALVLMFLFSLAGIFIYFAATKALGIRERRYP